MTREDLLDFMDSLTKQDRNALICELINIYCGKAPHILDYGSFSLDDLRCDTPVKTTSEDE